MGCERNCTSSENCWLHGTSKIRVSDAPHLPMAPERTHTLSRSMNSVARPRATAMGVVRPLNGHSALTRWGLRRRQAKHVVGGIRS